MRQATEQEISELPYYNPRLSFFYVGGGDDEYMEVAITVHLESTDRNHPTGAVLVQNHNIWASDSNQSGFKNPLLIRLHELGLCARRIRRIPSGQRYDLCRGCAKPHDHAESRVVRQAVSKRGDRLQGATVYLYGHWWCCRDCSDVMIRAGVSKVVLIEGAKAKFGR